ncbi:MAG: hypothetical protein ABI980_07775 [Nitrospirota bacterium]
MKHSRMIFTAFVFLLAIGGLMSCTSKFQSGFLNQAIMPTDLLHIKYRMLKAGAVGESTGFKFLWIPFVSPTEGAAKRDMVDQLKKEGIDVAGKKIAFTNAFADKGGFGFIGLIGAPTITLTADVIELLGEAPSEAVPPRN